MPGSQNDVDDIVKSVNAKEGKVEYPLTLNELQWCTRRILDTIVSGFPDKNILKERVKQVV